MNPAEEKELAAFPAALRHLVEEELAAGNSIVELGHGYPAAPCGAYVKLAWPVTTVERVSSPELVFYERNGSSHSGEFTEGPGHFFVLEPPLPPPPEPDMDAIRSDFHARCAAADAARFHRDDIEEEPLTASTVQSFAASMEMDFAQWHDGTGYDLAALESAGPSERAALESLLVSRGVRDWRDAQALAALGTAHADAVLRRAFSEGDESVRMAVLRQAPAVLSDGEREAFLVQLLDGDGIEQCLTEALLVLEEFHPRAVILAMVRALQHRDGVTACHLAGMLYFLHGKSSEPFDWNLRPFFLEFNTADPAARAVALRTLCESLQLPQP